MKLPILPMGLILILPLAGLGLADRDISPFLAFPPRPPDLIHAPFSLAIFILILSLILALGLITVPALARKPLAKDHPPQKNNPLPWWGKAALVSLGIFWILAWNRFGWFAPFQPHTFFPLWISLILVINGLAVKKSGTCPLTASPIRFLWLFPVSALFWWIFEYLNRFVGNWYYTGSQYPGTTYFLLATLSFSTVLPAVESMKAWLAGFAPMASGFKKGAALPLGRRTGLWLLGLGSLSLGCIGIFPDPLFFTIWIAPFCIIFGHALVKNRPHPFESLARGDYTPVAAYGSSALCCGFFWELFNVHSLARWEYSIPYVQAFHIFEMPVLGYAGYLPFGLECALIIHITYNRLDPHDP